MFTLRKIGYVALVKPESKLAVGVSSKHQRVNLYYCASGLDGVLKHIRFNWFEQNVPTSSLWVLLMLLVLKNS